MTCLEVEEGGSGGSGAEMRPIMKKLKGRARALEEKGSDVRRDGAPLRLQTLMELFGSAARQTTQLPFSRRATR